MLASKFSSAASLPLSDFRELKRVRPWLPGMLWWLDLLSCPLKPPPDQQQGCFIFLSLVCYPREHTIIYALEFIYTHCIRMVEVLCNSMLLHISFNFQVQWCHIVSRWYRLQNSEDSINRGFCCSTFLATLPVYTDWPEQVTWPCLKSIWPGSILNTELEMEKGEMRKERTHHQATSLIPSGFPLCLTSRLGKAAGTLPPPFSIPCLPAAFMEHFPDKANGEAFKTTHFSYYLSSLFYLLIFPFLNK